MFDDPVILEKERTLKPFNPFSGQSEWKIGNTRYVVSACCQGAEPILGKIKRLLLDDPIVSERFTHDKPA